MDASNSTGVGPCDPTISSDDNQSIACIMSRHYVWQRFFGPLIIGWIFATLLTGVMLAQFTSYLNWSFKRDRRLVAYSALAVVVINLVSAGIEWATLYIDTVTLIPFGLYFPFDPTQVFTTRDALAIILFSAMVTLMVQFHFTRSAYQWCRSKIFLVATSFFIVAAFCCSCCVFGTTIWFNHIIPNGNVPSQSQINFQNGVVYAALACNVLGDLCITSCLCYYLFKTRSQVPTTRTKLAIKEVFKLFISSCACTLSLSVGILIAWSITSPTSQTISIQVGTWAFVCLSIIHPRLWANTFLFVLNARPRIKESMKEVPLTLGISTNTIRNTDTNTTNREPFNVRVDQIKGQNGATQRDLEGNPPNPDDVKKTIS